MSKSSLPDIGLDKRSRAYKRYLDYLSADDSQQYDIVRDRWAQLNWSLLDQCEHAISSLAKGESTNKISPLIISAGIGFDKLYSKRSEQSKPLSFPAPLLDMVRKGLRLQLREAVSTQASQAGVQADTDSLGVLRTKQANVLIRKDSQVDIVAIGPSEASGALSAQIDACMAIDATEDGSRSGDSSSVTARTCEAPPDPATQGGVALADPQAAGRGPGPTLSRLDQHGPDISQKPKKTVPRPAGKTERAKAVRHARKATRAQMVQAIREGIRHTIKYQRPPEPGGIV